MSINSARFTARGEAHLAGKVLVVLQARTTSSRLPAKVLLPIAGIPLAILCARRLESSGRPVILATSRDRTDDVLALTAARAGINVFRGSLSDVLGRFVECVTDLDDDDLVVRATADNPLPNGAFVDALLQKFGETRQDYLATAWPADGLPYGVCAEVMTVSALRRAAAVAVTPFDREHVTPWLARQAAGAEDRAEGRLLEVDYSHLRATIDTLDDYLVLASAFAECERPLQIDWRALIPKLSASSHVSGRLSHLALGTAQLGLNYGATNQAGKPNDRESAAILGAAVTAGFAFLDTARAYGDSEARIGRLLPPAGNTAVKIITKLQSLDSVTEDASDREIRSIVDASVYGSCRDLRREQLDVLMLHGGKDMFRCRGAALDRLQELVDRGVIAALGVSVYTPEESIQSLLDARITHLQVPFNILDARWLDGRFTEALAQRTDVQVHARSVFLQGLLINQAGAWPAWVARAPLFVERLTALVEEFARKNRADLCMAYVRSFPWVSTTVIGVETLRQLEDLISCAAEPALTQEQVHAVRSHFMDVPSRLLNPSLW